MAIAEPSPDMGTYEPTPEDTVAASSDTPIDPDFTPDNDPNVAELDEVAVVTEGTPESEPTDMDGFTPGDRGTEDDLEVDPIYLEIDPGAIEIEDPAPEVDEDDGEIYDVSALPPDDAAWELVQDGTQEQVVMMAAATSDDPLVIEPLSEPLDEVDADRDTPVQYEIEGRSDGANWHNMATVPADSLETEVHGLPTEENWVFRVRAIFLNGEVGDWSAETPVVLPKDMLAPPVPSTPSVTAQRGVFTIKWDGMGLGGAPQPPDYKFTVVWTSDTGTAGTWNAIGTVDAAGDFMWSGGEYYNETFFSLSSFDNHGNSSERSTPVSAIMKPLVEEPDIAAELTRINEAHNGLITEATQLDARLDSARTDLDATKSSLEQLETVDLPAMDKRLSDADAAIRASQTELSTKLTAAEADLAGHQARLGEAEASLTTLNDTTLPALQSDLDAAEASLGTLDTRLGTTESELATASANLSSRLTTAEGGLSTAQTEIDKLETDVVLAAKTAAIESLYVTGTGTFSSAVIDKLWADVITARKISANQVLVGAGANLIPNANVISDIAGWVENSSSGLGRSVGVNGPTETTPYLHIGTQGNIRSERFSVEGGQKYRFRVSARASTSTSRFYVQVNTDGGSSPYPISNEVMTTSWTEYSGWITMPTNATWAYVNIYANHPNGTVAIQRFAFPSLVQMANGELIVAGSITGDHVEASSVAAKVATVIQLNADRINAGTINTARLNTAAIAAATASIQKADIKNLTVSSGTFSSAVIDKLWADVITARKILADQLVIGDGANRVPWKLEGSGRGLGHIRQYGGGTASDPVWGGTDGVTPGTGHLILNATWVAPGVDQYTWRIGATSTKSPWTTNGFPVEPGKSYTASVHYKSGGTYPDGTPNMRIAIVWYTGDGEYVAGNMSSPTPLTWAWAKHDISATAPATAAYANVYVRQDHQGNVRVDRPSFKEMTDGELIVAGSITGDHLEVNSVAAKVGQFIELDVSQLKSTSAKISDAVIEKLWSEVIHAKKITTDLLVVGAGNNAITDPLFENDVFKGYRSSRSDIDGAGWGRNSSTNLNWYGAQGQPTTRSKNFYFLASSGIADAKAFIPVEAGQQWLLRAKVNSAGAGARLTARYIRLDGSTGYVGLGSYSPTGVRDLSYTWEIPADYAYVQMAIQWHPDATSCFVYGGASFTRMSTGELIVDGSIIASKIDANAVTAGAIASNAVTADKINAGAVTAIKINAKAVTADKIATDAVTADKIKAGAINADAIASYAITGAKLHATAINGKTITGSTVQTTSTAYRGVKFDSKGIRAYDANGGVQVDIGGAFNRFAGRIASGPSSEPGATILPSSEHTSGYSGYWLTKQAGVMGGSETAGMWLEKPLNKYVEPLQLRGLNNGGVNIWGRLYSDDAYMGTILGPGAGYKIQAANGSWFNGSVEFRGRLLAKNTPNTTLMTNAHIDAYGTLYKSSSASRFKLYPEVMDASLDDKLLSIDAKTWVDRQAAEELAERMTPLASGEEEPSTPAPDASERVPGVIAEEVRDAGLPEFVTYNADGEIEGVMYDRLGVALIPVVRRQRDRINAQDAKIADLEAKLAALTAKVDALIAA